MHREREGHADAQAAARGAISAAGAAASENGIIARGAHRAARSGETPMTLPLTDSTISASSRAASPPSPSAIATGTGASICAASTCPTPACRAASTRSARGQARRSAPLPRQSRSSRGNDQRRRIDQRDEADAKSCRAHVSSPAAVTSACATSARPCPGPSRSCAAAHRPRPRSGRLRAHHDRPWRGRSTLRSSSAALVAASSAAHPAGTCGTARWRRRVIGLMRSAQAIDDIGRNPGLDRSLGQAAVGAVDEHRDRAFQVGPRRAPAPRACRATGWRCRSARDRVGFRQHGAPARRRRRGHEPDRHRRHEVHRQCRAPVADPVQRQ